MLTVTTGGITDKQNKAQIAIHQQRLNGLIFTAVSSKRPLARQRSHLVIKILWQDAVKLYFSENVRQMSIKIANIKIS